MIAAIAPGILVALRTKVVGGVEFRKKDLPAPKGGVPAGADAKRWEMTRVVDDPVEWDRARAARGQAQAKVNAVCVRTDFGLLCPEARADALDAAVDAARAIAAEFNATSTHSRVEVYVIRGRVASSDEEAARGIAAEVRALLDAVRDGIAQGSPEAIRDAASRAKRVSVMLDTPTQEKVASAVAEARAAAREVVRRVVEGGEDAAAVAAELQRTALDNARFAFLEVDEPAPAEVMPEAVASPELEVLSQEATMPAPSVKPDAAPPPVTETAAAAERKSPKRAKATTKPKRRAS